MYVLLQFWCSNLHTCILMLCPILLLMISFFLVVKFNTASFFNSLDLDNIYCVHKSEPNNWFSELSHMVNYDWLVPYSSCWVHGHSENWLTYLHGFLLFEIICLIWRLLLFTASVLQLIIKGHNCDPESQLYVIHVHLC